jgi:hypothetical protein
VTLEAVPTLARLLRSIKLACGRFETAGSCFGHQRFERVAIDVVMLQQLPCNTPHFGFVLS